MDDRPLAAPMTSLGSTTQRTRLGTFLVALLLASCVVDVWVHGDVGATVAGIALGAIEGITEFLPVSSTGHLVVARDLFGVGRRSLTDGFLVVVQVGAIGAVTSLYRDDLVAIVRGLLARRGPDARLGVALAIAVAPAAGAGVVAGDAIKDRLFRPGPISVAWLVGGIALLLVVPRVTGGRRGLRETGARDGLIIGSAQLLSLWPGTSRSLVTLVAALLLGFSARAAVELSFLLGLVTLAGASAFELATDPAGAAGGLRASSLVLALATAWGVAQLTMRTFVTHLGPGAFRLFGLYRIALGVAVGAWVVSSA